MRLFMIAMLAVLTGCTPATKLGAGAPSPFLQGQVTQQRIFVGGPVQDHTVVSGRNLVSGQSYSARGMLTVNGDVPPDTDITVELGKLVVKGNVGAGSSLVVNAPLVTHSDDRACFGPSMGFGYGSRGDFRYGMGYGFGHGHGGFGGSFDDGYRDCSRTVVDGLLYDDPAPAIQIHGGIGTDVNLRTHGRITVGGAPWPNPRQMQPYRPR